jgi:hypothetical protein
MNFRTLAAALLLAFTVAPDVRADDPVDVLHALCESTIQPVVFTSVLGITTIEGIIPSEGGPAVGYTLLVADFDHNVVYDLTEEFHDALPVQVEPLQAFVMTSSAPLDALANQYFVLFHHADQLCDAKIVPVT